jgi:DNA-binding transcriptional regulator PaaX
MYKVGPIQRKIMLTLLGGLALGCATSPRQYFKTFRMIRREWSKIDQRNFNRSIGRLSKEKLVEEEILSDGSFRLKLTKEGKKQAKIMSLFGSSINFKKPKKWDGKWRIVMFDIPEKDRVFRSILRTHLYELKFLKLQHSVFISPYPYEKPILELVNFYAANRYVRVITAVKVDNDDKFMKYFFKKLKS